jgi:hypothetical protein
VPGQEEAAAVLALHVVLAEVARDPVLAGEPLEAPIVTRAELRRLPDRLSIAVELVLVQLGGADPVAYGARRMLRYLVGGSGRGMSGHQADAMPNNIRTIAPSR